MRRVLLAGVICALALVPGAAGRSDVSKLLLGIAGDPARFQSQTGQQSAIKHVFLGWQQGMTWGSKIDVLLGGLGPKPMLHLGIGNPSRRAQITPLAIAQGKGDAYLVYLNNAIDAYDGTIFVRPMAEMNNPNTLYSPVNKAGGSRGPAFSPAAYKGAFCRFYVLLHGGTSQEIDAALRRCGLPALKKDLPANSTRKLQVIWNPLAGVGGWQAFYPGDARVDLVGNDIYGEGVDFSRAANEELYAFARKHGKRYSLPEWGVSVDQPDFVRYVCDFVKSHGAIVLAAYFESKGGSKWDLANKTQSRQAYRACLTPLERLG